MTAPSPGRASPLVRAMRVVLIGGLVVVVVVGVAAAWLASRTDDGGAGGYDVDEAQLELALRDLRALVAEIDALETVGTPLSAAVVSGCTVEGGVVVQPRLQASWAAAGAGGAEAVTAVVDGLAPLGWNVRADDEEGGDVAALVRGSGEEVLEAEVAWTAAAPDGTRASTVELTISPVGRTPCQQG